MLACWPTPSAARECGTASKSSGSDLPTGSLSARSFSWFSPGLEGEGEKDEHLSREALDEEEEANEQSRGRGSRKAEGSCCAALQGNLGTVDVVVGFLLAMLAYPCLYYLELSDSDGLVRSMCLDLLPHN